ncbi:MAG: NAD(P)H-binding protein [Rubrivivax sp.]|nr:NAD(P)H-binding protein [Rubrivivax sp.]
MSTDGRAPPRRALVLGATGHIGQAIVHELLAQGWQVTATTRQSQPEALAGLGPHLTVARGDADRPGQLAAWVPGHDAVFDAAAPYPVHLFVTSGDTAQAPLAQARQRTAALLDAVGRAGAVLAYVSSFTTLPRPADEGPLGALEAWARRRLHPYFAVKAAMEAMVLQAAGAGLPAAVLNPSACLGPWDRRPRELCVVPLLAAGQVPALVRQPLNVIDVRDVARAARLALEQRLFGQPIALAGHDSRSDQLAAQVCRLAGVAAPRRRWPARLVAGGMLSIEAGWAMLGWPSPVPALGSLLVLEGHAMPPSEAQRRLGVLPRPLADTLRDALAWYRRIGYC